MTRVSETGVPDADFEAAAAAFDRKELAEFGSTAVQAHLDIRNTWRGSTRGFAEEQRLLFRAIERGYKQHLGVRGRRGDRYLDQWRADRPEAVNILSPNRRSGWAISFSSSVTTERFDGRRQRHFRSRLAQHRSFLGTDDRQRGSSGSRYPIPTPPSRR